MLGLVNVFELVKGRNNEFVGHELHHSRVGSSLGIDRDCAGLFRRHFVDNRFSGIEVLYQLLRNGIFHLCPRNDIVLLNGHKIAGYVDGLNKWKLKELIG